MELSLYNSLTRKKEKFTPLHSGKVGLYACGPTVYDRAHIGNARAVVVYDLLFRLLRHIYGESNVTYVRNITDVDDKINAAAIANKETIQSLTRRVTQWFHDDMAELGNLPPTHEPRATQYIPQMINLIEKMIANGSAYASQGHVLFDVTKSPHYGCLSGRVIEEQKAGARIEVESYKKNPGDFVLWKPTPAGDDPSSVFDSPWGKGRPGWHIECSAMSTDLLGHSFDIHGGGADLKFPHHENEIAQSCGAFGYKPEEFAKFWVHNGFVTVNGEKMSKSLGNFTTVHDLLEKGISGEVIRFALLSAKYSEPLDWNDKLIHDAQKLTSRLGRAAENATDDGKIDNEILAALLDDMNTPKAIARLLVLDNPADLKKSAAMLGLLQNTATAEVPAEITSLAEARLAARKSKNFAEADRLRAEISKHGYVVEDKADGYEVRKA